MNLYFLILILLTPLAFAADLNGTAVLSVDYGEVEISSSLKSDQNGTFIELERKAGPFCYIKTKLKAALRKVDEDGGIVSRTVEFKAVNIDTEDSCYLEMGERKKIVYRPSPHELCDANRYILYINVLSRGKPSADETTGDIWKSNFGQIKNN